MVGAISRIVYSTCLSVISVALPGTLHAATFYVAPGGDDGNLGTIEAPFATVQEAHDNAALQPGDVIYLRGGTYDPTQQTVFTKDGSENAYFEVRSYPGELPVIDGENVPEGDTNGGSTPTWVFNSAEYWKVVGPLHLTNGRGAGVFIDGSRFLEFDLVESSYNGKRAARAGHGFFIWGSSTSDILFKNCDGFESGDTSAWSATSP